LKPFLAGGAWSHRGKKLTGRTVHLCRGEELTRAQRTVIAKEKLKRRADDFMAERKAALLGGKKG